MPKGSLSFSVAKNPAEAFAYIADMRKAPEWVPDLVRVEQLTPGELGVGTRFSEVVKMGSSEMEGSLEVTEYDPPRAYAHDGEGGPTRFTARFTFEPEGPGTRITHDYSVTLSGAMKLMGPVIGSWVKRNAETAIENLQRRLSE